MTLGLGNDRMPKNDRLCWNLKYAIRLSASSVITTLGMIKEYGQLTYNDRQQL